MEPSLLPTLPRTVTRLSLRRAVTRAIQACGNIIDRRIYDHASIPATLEALFNLQPMTNRDKAANSLTSLITLTTPRPNTPATLPAPVKLRRLPLKVQRAAMLQQKRLLRQSADTGNVPGFLGVALKADPSLSPKAEHAKIRARFKKIKTRAHASAYMRSVQTKISVMQSVDKPRSR